MDQFPIVNGPLEGTGTRCGELGNRRLPIGHSTGSRFVYWMLIVMGLSTFAPCIILPEWREYQALRQAEQAERHRLTAMQDSVERERSLLEAMQSDPAVIARLAQRDLNFRRPGERTVSVSVPVTGARIREPLVAEPIEPSNALARARSYMPDFNYDALFCDDRTRPIIMVMSVGLILTAIAVFSNKAPLPNP